jgi:hypothetical protein
MRSASALRMISGKIIFNSQFWKICGFSRIAFSREGLQRRTAFAALVSYGNIRAAGLPLPSCRFAAIHLPQGDGFSGDGKLCGSDRKAPP